MGILVAALAVCGGMVGCSTTAGVVKGATLFTAVATPKPQPTAAVQVPIRGTGLDQQVPVAVAPVRFRIESLGVDMTVAPVGLTSTGSMELPPDPANAGWYQYGSWPASAAGATVIAAHVDSLYYDIGPLAKLPQATVGTEIIVTTADGKDNRYVVQNEGMVTKPDVPWGQVFDRTGQPRLTIVTCGGEFDYTRRTYLDNVVVTALPEG